MSGVVLYTLLSGEPDVTDLVGERIYPDTAEQGKAGDYVVFREVVTTPTDTKQQTSRKDVGRWQVDGYCRVEDDRNDLKAAIRKALDFKKGTIAGENIEQIRFINSNGNFDDEGEKFRTSQDFAIHKHRS